MNSTNDAALGAAAPTGATYRQIASAARVGLRGLAWAWRALDDIARRHELAARCKAELNSMDARLLKDIGLTRLDLLRLQGKRD